MIVFDLRCLPNGHVFEAWFGSSDDYVSQQERGLLQCPLCGSEALEKAVMAPRVAPKGNRSEQATPIALSDAGEAKAMLAAMAAAQQRLISQSEYVGERFSEEARAIHLGEAEARSIYGKATAAQAEGLVEEGIGVTPLPFPVCEPGREN